jgi:hypothetical protein
MPSTRHRVTLRKARSCPIRLSGCADLPMTARPITAPWCDCRPVGRRGPSSTTRGRAVLPGRRLRRAGVGSPGRSSVPRSRPAVPAGRGHYQPWPSCTSSRPAVGGRCCRHECQATGSRVDDPASPTRHRHHIRTIRTARSHEMVSARQTHVEACSASRTTARRGSRRRPVHDWPRLTPPAPSPRTR